MKSKSPGDIGAIVLPESEVTKPAAEQWAHGNSPCIWKKRAINNGWLGIGFEDRNIKVYVLNVRNRRPLAVLVSEGQGSDPPYLLPLLEEVGMA